MKPNEYDDLLSKIKCSDEFRSRMEEKLSAPAIEVHEYEESVSGTDVITARHSWGRIAAIAAAFVLVCGAVGGGAYYRFSQSDKNNHTEDDSEYGSIYELLKANKDKYKMTVTGCVYDGAVVGFPDGYADTEKFYEFMDALDINNKAKELTKGSSVLDTAFSSGFSSGTEGDVIIPDSFKESAVTVPSEYVWEGDSEVPATFRKMPRHIKFSFGTEDDIRYIFDLYENGCFTWTDNTDGMEKIKYYDNASGAGEKLFYNFEVLYDVEGNDPENWNDVDEEEIKDFISERQMASRLDSSIPPNCALKHEGNKTKMFEIRNSDYIENIILGFEWVRASGFDSSDYYSVNGMSISEGGYMAGYYKGCYAVYKLKEELMSEKLSMIWTDEMMVVSTDVNEIKEELQQVNNETTVQWLEGPTGVPQGRFCYDTIARYYTVSDPESFRNEIVSLEWVCCTNDEVEENTGYQIPQGWYCSYGSYNIGESGYGGKLVLYPGGYINIADTGSFKLANESDIETFDKIFDKYLVMDESSKLAEKIHIGITNYNNLKANFICENDYGNGVTLSVSGYMSYDAKNEKLYMKGDGNLMYQENENTIELIMNGHDKSAFRAVEKETGKHDRFGTYAYSNGYASPPPDNYIYICKSIEGGFAPRMPQNHESDLNCSIREADGNTELYWQGETEEEYYSIVLTEKGQLISYEVVGENYKTVFKLYDYVFDSPDFTMEDVGTIYESIREEQEEEYRSKAN